MHGARSSKALVVVCSPSLHHMLIIQKGNQDVLSVFLILSYLLLARSLFITDNP